MLFRQTLKHAVGFLALVAVGAGALPRLQARAETPRQVAIDLDGTLVQGIRSAGRGHYSAEDVLTIQMGDENKYFHVLPYARELVTLLSNRTPRPLIYFVSSEDSVKVNALLKLMKLTSGNRTFLDVAAGVMTKEKFTAAVPPLFDLAQLGGALSDTVYVTSETSRVVGGQESSLLQLGPIYYYYNTFADSQNGANAIRNNPALWAKHGRFFPATEAEFDAEHGKLARAYAILDEALDVPANQFIASLTRLETEDAALMRNVGSKKLLGRWEAVSPQWKISKTNGITWISGCDEFDNRAGKVIRSTGMDACRAKLQVEAAWTLKGTQPEQVKACVERDVVNKYPIQDLPFDTCLEALTHNYYWVGNKRDKCAAFTDTDAQIRAVDPSHCSDRYFIFDEELGKATVVQEDITFAQFSWAQVITRVRIPPPDAAHLDRLWFPYDKKEDVGFTLRNCQTGDSYHHAVRMNGSTLIEECKPDTLYSWGPQIKLDNLKNWMGDGTWVKTFRPLFMTRSPLATHGYGAVPIRLRIKRTAKWVNSNNGYQGCAGISEAEAQNTIFFRVGDLMDYVICSPNVIESWSHGTPEHYDEIIKELKWVETPGRSVMDVELYDNDDINIFNMNWDGFDFSRHFFFNSLAGLFQGVQAKREHIYFNAHADAPVRTRAAHFMTTRPIYYNER